MIIEICQYEIKFISVEFWKVVKKKKNPQILKLFLFRGQADKGDSVKEIVEKAAGKIREKTFPEVYVMKVFQEGRVVSGIKYN